MTRGLRRGLRGLAALILLTAPIGSGAQDDEGLAPAESVTSPAGRAASVTPVGVRGAKRLREKPNTELSLFFPIEKTNVKILPQRFEYELIDKDKFRVGNVLFDARLFEFRVGRGSDDKFFRLKLKWPAGLLAEGEISIRDNIGKAIWIHPIDQETVKFKRRRIEDTNQTLAELEGDILPEDVFRGLQFVPYFQVCVQKAELPTRISLCSKDFFVQVKKGRLEIRTRDSLRQESFVNINGTKVDPQGVIFLTSLSDVISMRVLLLSGATLDIDTRMKEVEFRDIASNDAKGRLMLTGYGAEPSAGHRFVKLADGSWRTEVSLQRPVVYLRGEGDIPMRQEFVIDGDVRDQSMRVDVVDQLPIATYSSSVTIDLKKNPRLKVLPGEGSEIEDAEDHWEWTLTGLSDTQKNRRFLIVDHNGQKFTAAWDVIRHPRWDLTAALALPFDARMHLRGWMSNQNLGFGLDYQYFVTEWKKDAGPTSRARLPIYYSFPDHYNFLGNAWGVMIAPETYTFKTGSASGLQVGGFAQLGVPEGFSLLGTWSQTELGLLTVGAGDPKISSEIFLRNEFLYPDGHRRYYFWALEFNQLKTDTAGTAASFSRVELQAGLKWQF